MSLLDDAVDLANKLYDEIHCLREEIRKTDQHNQDLIEEMGKIMAERNKAEAQVQKLEKILVSMVDARRKTKKVRQERQELNVTVETVAWVLSKVNETIETEPSFRRFIYGLMGFDESAYSALYAAGGMNITNFISEALDAIQNRQSLTEQLEYMKKTVDATAKNAESHRKIADDLRGSWEHAQLKIAGLTEEMKNLKKKCWTLYDELQKVYVETQLDSNTTVTFCRCLCGGKWILGGPEKHSEHCLLHHPPEERNDV